MSESLKEFRARMHESRVKKSKKDVRRKKSSETREAYKIRKSIEYNH